MFSQWDYMVGNKCSCCYCLPDNIICLYYLPIRADRLCFPKMIRACMPVDRNTYYMVIDASLSEKSMFSAREKLQYNGKDSTVN